MKTHNTIFPKMFFDNFNFKKIRNISEKISKINSWINSINNGFIQKSNEEELQSSFLNLFFGEILDYDYQVSLNNKNIKRELKTKIDGTKPDASLGYFSEHENIQDVQAVIELKKANINLDKKYQHNRNYITAVEQAFGYVPKVGGNCQWVIVSNFIEIRLYSAFDASTYEKIEITELINENELNRFFCLFHKNFLLSQKGKSKLKIEYNNLKKNNQNSKECQTANFFYQYPKQTYHVNSKIKSELIDKKSEDIYSKYDNILQSCIKRIIIKDFGLIKYLEINKIPIDINLLTFVSNDEQILTDILKSIAIGLYGKIDNNKILTDSKTNISIEFKNNTEDIINNLDNITKLENLFAFGYEFNDKQIDILERPIYSILYSDFSLCSFENKITILKYSNPQIFNKFKKIVLSFLNEIIDIKEYHSKLLFTKKIDNKNLSINFKELNNYEKKFISLIGSIIVFFSLKNENYQTTENFVGIVIINKIERIIQIPFYRDFIKLINTVFYNIQFIISTESPIIMQFVNIENIFMIERSNDDKILCKQLKKAKPVNSFDIENLFGKLDNDNVNNKYAKIEKEIENLINKK